MLRAFANRIVGAVPSGDKVQIPWLAWHFMRCDENFEVLSKTHRKTLILKLQSVKIGGSLARNARFDAPTCLVSSLFFSCGFAVSMREAAKPFLFEGIKAGCNVVLRGRRSTL